MHQFAKILLSAICIAVCCAPVHAKAEPAQEQRLKTAFLYNFTKFVTWSNANAGSTISLCTFGADWLGEFVNKINNKPIRGRVLNVRRDIPLETLKSCDILYLGGLASSRRVAVLTILQDSDTLTIADGMEFAHQGGVISFLTKSESRQFSKQTSLGFAINVDVAKRHRLTISSHLMRLAKIVRE